MTERTYDPIFAVRPVPNHEGECQFVRRHHFFESCTVPGCPVSRMALVAGIQWLSLEEMRERYPRAD